MWQIKVKSGKIKVENSSVSVQSEFSQKNMKCNLEVLTMKVKENYNVDDAIDLIFDGNQSDLSVHSQNEEEIDEIEDAVQNNISDYEPTDAAESDDDIPLASLAGAINQTSYNDQFQANNNPAQCILLQKQRYDCL